MDALSVRRELGIDDQKVIVLMYGAIAQRKGLATLLSALADPKMHPNVVGLIVGRFDHACGAYLKNWLAENSERQNRLHFMDRYVTNVEEANCLAACDIVWLAYQGHLTMSGVLVQAGQYKKPCVGSGDGLIGWYIKEHGIGIALVASDTSTKIEDAVAAMSELASSPDKRNAMGELGHSVFKSNSVETFQQTLFAGLKYD